VGRIASLEPGDELELPNGEVITVNRITLLNPFKRNLEWDSRRNRYEDLDDGPLTIDSLLALFKSELKSVDHSDEPDTKADLLALKLAQDSPPEQIHEGTKRDVIANMALRDQAILDKYQDEIFRLPIDSKLLILGAPGTGKTTTLIRRLGQKLDAQYLSDDERELSASIEQLTRRSAKDSWLMFTPTELLRQYVKEASYMDRLQGSSGQKRFGDIEISNDVRIHFNAET
jgi:predicted NACHT family NTPase